VEQQVEFGEFIGDPGAFGTADSIMLSSDGKTIITVDLKYGRSPVDAENNTQMMLYALGALHSFGMIFDTSSVEKVIMVIAQPRIGAFPAWECDLAHLMAFSERAKIAVDKAERADNLTKIAFDPEMWAKLYLNPTEKGCKWCKAKGKCPALAADNMEAIMGAPTTEGLPDLDADTRTPEDTVRDVTLAMPEVPWDEVVRYYKLLPRITEWVKAVEDRVVRKMLSGEATHPDLKVVRGRDGNRKWVDEAGATAYILTEDTGGVKLYTEKALSPAQMEKATKKMPDVWKGLQAFIGREEGKLAVALKDDKREAIEVISPLNLLSDETETLTE
jgi:hypothetical protein